MEHLSIGAFLTLVLLTTASATGVCIIGLDIPILRQVAGFLFLVVIPGAVILRILKLPRLNAVDVLLYSVGLSISFVMFLGVLMNFLYPIVGISRPLSTFPVIVTFAIAILLLCFVAYKRENPRQRMVDLSEHVLQHPNTSSLAISKPALFLISLPILSILGAILLNFYENNIVLLVLLAILPTVPILAVLDRIPKSLYPLAVVSVTISLLFQNSLISMNLVEWGDSTFEYYFSSLVLKNSFWNSSIYHDFNTILSTLILGPLLSEICNLSLEWVFKIVYPIVFSLVPLGIYRVVQKQTSDKIAFLSSFFFVSTFVTFTTGLGEARFQIASLFLILLLLLVVSKTNIRWKTALLSSVFLFSLIVSHYALATIFSIILIIALGLIFLVRNLPGRFLTNIRERNNNVVLTLAFGILCITSLLTWFTYVASAHVFDALVGRAETFGPSFLTDLFSPSARGLSNNMVQPRVPLLYATQIIYLVAQFFILVGLLEVLFSKKGEKITGEYLVLSIAAFVVTYVGLVVPLFAYVGITRLYHMNLLFLSPFCVIGGIALCRRTADLTRKLRSRAGKLTKTRWNNDGKQISLKTLSVFFSIYLLFSTGLVFEVANTPVPFSLLSLNSAVMRANGGIAYWAHFNDVEMTTATWLTGCMNTSTELDVDFNSAYLFMMLTGSFSPMRGDKNGTITTSISQDAYVFLGTENIVDGYIRLSNSNPAISLRGQNTIAPLLKNSTFYNALLNSDKIYDAGNAQVFKRVP